MGAVTAILGAANIGMTAYQGSVEAQNRRREAELAANGLEARAARKDLEADEALRIGTMNVREHEIKRRINRTARRVAYASSGVKVDEGSAAAVVADQAAWDEYDRQKIAYGAELQSWGLSYDAAMLRQDAANTRAAGSAGVAGSQLSSALNGAEQLLGRL